MRQLMRQSAPIPANSANPRPLQRGPKADYMRVACGLAGDQTAMKRIITLDAQGHKELLEEIARANARMKEIEEESAKRTGRELPPIALRQIALPASEELAAEVRAEESRRRGNPPL